MHTRILILAVLVLGQVASTPAATRHWDGGGTSGFWDTAANWSNNVAVVNGDALFFPTNVARLINTNRASANLTNFDTLRFTGAGYQVFSVPSINLTNGLTNASSINTSNTLNAALQLRRNQTWAVGGRTSLTLNSNVNWTGLFLTNDLDGTLVANGNWNGSGAAQFIKTGGGRLELNGTLNSIPTVRVIDGTLQVDGMLTAATSFVISNSASLTGTGSVSAFTCAGDFSPGGSSTPGLLTMTGAGNAAFTTGARFFANIDGLSPGLDHDQFRTPTPPNLSGATLLLLRSFAFPFSVGQKFVIITNTGAAAQGTAFANLAQNARVTNSGVVFQISYTGGSGNDVELTVVDAPFVGTGVTRTWDGGGNNAFFSNPTNWVGDVVPQDGDSILFPTGLPAADRLATNNLSIRFNQLLCASNGGSTMTLRGQPLLLAGGILATQESGGLLIDDTVSFLNGGPIQVGAGNLVLDGPVNNGGSDITISGGSGQVLVNSVMSGGGGLVVSNSGGVELNNGNTYQGTTRLLRGAVTVAAPSSLGASTNGTFVAEGIQILVTSTRLFENFISLTGSVTFTATITSNILSAIEFGGTNTTMLAGPSATVDFFGPWSGNGTVQLDQGEYVLASTHAVAGGIKVANRGRFRVNGTGTSDITFGFAGGTLSGTGSVGRVGVSASPLGQGRIEPGNGPGILTTSNLVLGATVTNVFELNGTSPGSSHDQLRVLGTVNLANSRLQLSLGYVPAVGDTFVVIDNDGADPVTGTFAGLAEGASVIAGTNGLRLTYAGGDGNDVALTVLEDPFVPTGITRTWDAGGGNNRNWSSAANWDNNTLPARGDDLVFPASVSDAASLRFVQNNLPINSAAFNRLWFGGQGGTWSIEGNAVKLFAGVAATNAAAPTGNASFGNTKVELIGSQTWSATNMNLAVNTPTFLNGHTLTLASDPTGSIFLQHALLSPGTLVMAGGNVNLFSADPSFNVTVRIQGANVIGGNSEFFGEPWQMSAGSFRPGATRIPGLQMTGGKLDLSGGFAGAIIAGDLTLAQPVNLFAQFDSATNPLLVVTGQVNLATARLSVGFTDIALLGTPLMLIEKTSPGAITGRFVGLAEGGFRTATNEANGLVTRYRISYSGGDGNDVTLTPVAPPPTGLTRTWTGAGADALWPTLANWTGNTPPTNGDTAIFPVNAAQRANSNASPGLVLDAIEWRGSNYLHSGTISLLSGLRHGAAGGTNSISEALLLTYGANTWAVSNSAATLRVARENEEEAGSVEGLGPVTKTGAGVLELENLNFDVSGGLLANGGITRLRSMDFTDGSSLFVQAGRVEAIGVSAESVLATNGELTLLFAPVLDEPGEVFGGLFAFGGATLDSNLTLTVQWTNGVSAALQAPTLALNGARLNVTTPGGLPADERIRIAQYDFGGLTGEFANLPEGAVTNIAGRDWEIHYAVEILGESASTHFITLSPPVLAPRFTSIERLENGDVILRGTANPGATVNIEAAEALETFILIGSTVANGAGQFTFIDNSGALTQRFYQAVLPTP